MWKRYCNKFNKNFLKNDPHQKKILKENSSSPFLRCVSAVESRSSPSCLTPRGDDRNKTSEAGVRALLLGALGTRRPRSSGWTPLGRDVARGTSSSPGGGEADTWGL